MAASAPLVAALDVGWLKSALEAYVFSVPLYVIYLVAVLGVYFGLTFRLFGTFYRVAVSRLGVRRGRWPGVISAAYFLGVVAMWFLSGGPVCRGICRRGCVLYLRGCVLGVCQA